MAQKIHAKTSGNSNKLQSLWTADGFRLYEKLEVWHLIEQDDLLIAHDRPAFPGGNKRAAPAASAGGSAAPAPPAADDDAAAAAPAAPPAKKAKRAPTAYNRFIAKEVPVRPPTCLLRLVVG